MRSKITTLALMAGLIMTLSVGAFAAQKKSAATHAAKGTITSINANQVVITEKVKGKETPMTFALDNTTQKSGSLAVGTPVTIKYRAENNQNIATAVQETPSKAAKSVAPKTDAKKPSK